ncbi:MAG: hypothetical protein WCE45_05360 [Sedimentisphaerales bacterium]
MYSGTLKQPPSNRKKIMIIAVIAVVFCLSASGGLYYMLKGSSQDRTDAFGRRRREWRDANLPNPDKQKPQEIMAYMDSAEFKKLAPRKQFEYMRQGGQQVMEYQMETYFSLPDEKQKTAYLDQIIDRMQNQRANFRPPDANGPRRFRDANDPNDPNRPSRRQGQAGGRTRTASSMRARSERGMPLQQAQREQFRAAMRKRMQQRGITMPGPGGRGGPRGPGGSGGPPPGR